MRKFLYEIKAPVLLLILVLIIELLASKDVLPSVDQLLNSVNFALTRYGPIVIGPLAFLENIVGLNVYFPGSTIILAAMALTAGHPAKGLLIYLIYSGFAFMGYCVDYSIGAKLLRKRNQLVISLDFENQSRSKMWARFLSTFWHPHLAALTSIHVGSEGLRYTTFVVYAIPSGLLWNAFWGVVMYQVGTFMGPSLNFKGLAYVYISIWLGVSIYRHYTAKTRL